MNLGGGKSASLFQAVGSSTTPHPCARLGSLNGLDIPSRGPPSHLRLPPEAPWTQRLSGFKLKARRQSDGTFRAGSEHKVRSGDASGVTEEKGDIEGEGEYSVLLKKPLGIVFRELKGGGVAVDSLVKGGHADRTGGMISPGDVLLSTTAQAVQEGSSNPESIDVPVEKESFDSIMAAIRSNTCANCSITLTFRRV